MSTAFWLGLIALWVLSLIATALVTFLVSVLILGLILKSNGLIQNGKLLDLNAEGDVEKDPFGLEKPADEIGAFNKTYSTNLGKNKRA